MSDGEIPFNKVVCAGAELEHITTALLGGHVSGVGPYTARCEAALTEITGSVRTLLTTSCTHALEMAALLLDLGPGDEVIVPSFTFVSTASAVAMRGAVPVFCDVREDTWCLDESLLDELVTERTRAVIVMHYGGVACEMDEILAWAQARGVAVIEDNAHGLFGSYRGRPLGSLGDLSTLSFHETKNISCGEGGALQINRLDMRARAEVLREKGTNRSSFFRGEVDRYTWLDLGSSWVPSDMLAAFLWGQIEQHHASQQRRHAIWSTYAAELVDWMGERGFVPMTVAADREHPAHLFAVRAPSAAERGPFLEHLRARGIYAVFHYVPLHASPAGEALGRAPLPLPVTEAVSASLVRLPLWAGMEERHVAAVVDAVRSFG